MAKRRRKTPAQPEIANWLWMLFGLAIGLSVALAIFVNFRTPRVQQATEKEQPASVSQPVESAVDDNSESVPDEEPRFTFYDMLPKFEVVIPEEETDVAADTDLAAVDIPGVYVLQAGSFSAYADADRRRAQLALHGIESRIQRVSIDEKTYHRVRIGPIDDLDKLNVTRRRLRQANIDVLRIRLGD